MLLAAIPAMAQASVYVQGYIRSDGTYVPGHYRSAPNSTVLDNYSTKGNTNPYTGKAGTKDPYAQPSSAWVPRYEAARATTYAPLYSTPKATTYTPYVNPYATPKPAAIAKPHANPYAQPAAAPVWP
jgi:hypothetical protein